MENQKKIEKISVKDFQRAIEIIKNTYVYCKQSGHHILVPVVSSKKLTDEQVDLLKKVGFIE